MFWIPIALMAASAAASAAAARKQKKAANAAREIDTAGRAEWHARNKQAVDKLRLFAGDQYDPTKRAERWTQAGDRVAGARIAELGNLEPGQRVSTSSADTGASTLAYAGQKAAEEGTRMRDVVKLLAKASAPQTAGYDEGVGTANAFSEFGNDAANANNILKAYGGVTDERTGKIGSAGSSQNLLSSLFAAGASMYGGK